MNKCLIIVFSLLVAWPAAAPAQTTNRPPNVLFIAIDDLNDWGLAALDGRKGVIAPNLERLAARGTLFLNAHCAAPACNPSRTAILTGVAPHRSGVYSNGHDWRVNERLRDVLTLPEYVRKHGYTATGGGKILHALEWIDGPSDGFNDAKCWDMPCGSKKAGSCSQCGSGARSPRLKAPPCRSGASRPAPFWGPTAR